MYLYTAHIVSRRFTIAKRTKSKNRMQITEFPARLSQQKRILREIHGMKAKFSFHKCFRNTRFCPSRNLQNHPPLQFLCLSLVLVITSLVRFAILIREFTKPRRRRRGQRRVKTLINILPTNLATLQSHLLCLSLSKLAELNPEHKGKFKIKI